MQGRGWGELSSRIDLIRCAQLAILSQYHIITGFAPGIYLPIFNTQFVLSLFSLLLFSLFFIHFGDTHEADFYAPSYFDQTRRNIEFSLNKNIFYRKWVSGVFRLFTANIWSRQPGPTPEYSSFFLSSFLLHFAQTKLHVCLFNLFFIF